ncbi:hypothetical protein [Tunturibacter empetritectus]|uniref:Uncharacterized protein n=1 Tax=Tunturiibacter lichenicola TaxID=2051959 RepID=A0A7W8N4Y4_9BACT|nr:hypothetical protein [Edaphobacter lichenicola]MBB5343400.1 hypothetical protein [Edaphobacter lichenicola]
MLMPLLGRSVVLGDLLRGDLDGAVLLDHFCDLVIGLAALAQRLNLIADHADEGLDRKLFRSESGGRTESFLGFDGFFNRVHLGFAHVGLSFRTTNE